jgi:hypothetical protein
MSPFEQNKITKGARWFSVAVMMAVLFFAPSWMHAAVQGETGSNFTLSASAGYVAMPARDVFTLVFLRLNNMPR